MDAETLLRLIQAQAHTTVTQAEGSGRTAKLADFEAFLDNLWILVNPKETACLTPSTG